LRLFTSKDVNGGHIGGLAQFCATVSYDNPLGVLHIGLIDLHAGNLLSYTDPVGHVGLDVQEPLAAVHVNPGGHIGDVVVLQSLIPDGVYTGV
jgi:hypothetical protein